MIAQLINDQKVIIKVSGEVIPANDHRMIGFLRNKSYIGQTNISRREKVNQLKLNNARTFLREYLDVMTVPTDEDGLPNRCLDPEINSNLSIVLLEEPFVEWLGYNLFEEPVVEKKRKWFGK